jgi:septum formation protein
MTSVTEPCQVDLILASASPRRKSLLRGLGVRLQVSPSSLEEICADGETPEQQVRRLAAAKAGEVAAETPGFWVLGADTIVVIDGMILGKPETESHAKAMLAMLSDKEHRVYTGYALINKSYPEKTRVRHVMSSVRIRELTADEITAYVNTGEPMDKAGSYAIQGMGAAIVASISGSYTNVVGLPLCEVAQDLKQLGIFDFLKTGGEP